MAVLPRHAEGERGTASESAVGTNHSTGSWNYTRIKATAGNGRRSHFPAISRPFGASPDNRPIISETASRGPQNCPLLTKCGAQSHQPKTNLERCRGGGDYDPPPRGSIATPGKRHQKSPAKATSRWTGNDDAGPRGFGAEARQMDPSPIRHSPPGSAWRSGA